LSDAFLANMNSLPETRLQQYDQLNDPQWMYPLDNQPYPMSYPSQDQSFQFPNTNYNQRSYHAPKDPKDLLALVGIPEANASADVLHAASTLFSYRANPNQVLGPTNYPQPVAQQQPLVQNTSRHASFPFSVPTTTSSSAPQHPSTNGHFRASFDNSTTNSHSHPHSHTSSSHQSSTPMFHFGTDNNFRQSGYAAPYQDLEANTIQHVEFARNMVQSSNDAMSSVENSVPHTPDLSRGVHNYYPGSMQALASLADQTSTGESDQSKNKKRRNIIKQGYEDLNDLVPNLKTGGFSKSAVLTETTRFLEEIHHGNNSMEAYLRSLAAEKGVPFEL
jgi:hypothetical protein